MEKSFSDYADQVSWVVLRHSGRSGVDWRLRYRGVYGMALTVYRDISERLRQGTVVLLRPNGTEQERMTAPRLRTRW